jgi:uracil-DNA glycosylase
MSNKDSLEFDFEEAEIVKKGELFKDCTNFVVGDGNLNAKILFVGEAPGRMEDIEGVPFVGAAGKNLDKLLDSVGLSRKEDVYIANILKCRPPENRDPFPEEIKDHTPWLLKQIREIKPKVVCSLGNFATKFFLSGCNVSGMKDQPGITLIHGKVKMIECEGMKIKLIPLFHPAAIIYNRKLLPLWEKDLEFIKGELSQEDLC